MVHIVANGASGAGRALRKAEVLVAELNLLSLKAVVHRTPSADEATKLVQSLPDQATVVSAGGDGTHRAVATGCVGTPRTMALLPAGTGNDYARGLGLEQLNPAGVATAIHQGLTRQVDVGLVWLNDATEPKIFLNAFGMGFDADVAAHLRRLRGAPPLVSYAATVLKRLPHLKAQHLTVRSEKTNLWSGRSILTAAMVGKQTGGGFAFAPHATFEDGTLNVVIGGSLGPIQFAQAAMQLLRSVPLDVDDVKTLRDHELNFEWAEPVHMHLDGDPQGAISFARLGVRPRALNLITQDP